MCYISNFDGFNRTLYIFDRNNSTKNNEFMTDILCYIYIYISLFAQSETMIVSIEHSKTHSKYKYNNYIQQEYITV